MKRLLNKFPPIIEIEGEKFLFNIFKDKSENNYRKYRVCTVWVVGYRKVGSHRILYHLGVNENLKKALRQSYKDLKNSIIVKK